MKRILGQFFTVAAVATLVQALVPACAANDETIYIRSAQAPPTTRQNGVCTYQPDPTQPFLPEGSLDLFVRDSYNAYLLVGSQLLSRGDSVQARAEPNRAHLNGAVVTVTDTAGTVIGAFTATGTGFVDPQANNSTSFGLLGVTLIDATTAQKIAPSLPDNAPKVTKLVIVNVKAFGKTLGGVDLETAEFQFPIRVCKGCLISFLTGDDPATPGEDCNLSLGASTTGGAATILPCQLGQDEVTPCQLCARENEFCRARPQ